MEIRLDKSSSAFVLAGTIGGFPQKDCGKIWKGEMMPRKKTESKSPKPAGKSRSKKVQEIPQTQTSSALRNQPKTQVVDLSSDPIALTKSYLKGEILWPGDVFRTKLFAHVEAAIQPEQIAKIREALKLVPNMRWDAKHIPILQSKGLI